MEKKYWELFYRGYIGKWVDLFKNENKKDIENSQFKEYLDLRKDLEAYVAKLNQIEKNIEENYPLLKSIPITSSTSENQSNVNELIVYINSKK
jgi:hypothetical protein